MKVKQKIKEEPNMDEGKLKVEHIKKEYEVGDTSLHYPILHTDTLKY